MQLDQKEGYHNFCSFSKLQWTHELPELPEHPDICGCEWRLPRWSNPGFHLAVLQDCVAQISYPKTLDGDISQLGSYSKHYSFPLYMLRDVWSEDNRRFPNFPFPLTLCNSTHLPRVSPSPVASGASNSSIAEHSHIHTGLGILFIFLLLCLHKSHISDPYKINVTEKSTPDQDRLPF